MRFLSRRNILMRRYPSAFLMTAERLVRGLILYLDQSTMIAIGRCNRFLDQVLSTISDRQFLINYQEGSPLPSPAPSLRSASSTASLLSLPGSSTASPRLTPSGRPMSQARRRLDSSASRNLFPENDSDIEDAFNQVSWSSLRETFQRGINDRERQRRVTLEDPDVTVSSINSLDLQFQREYFSECRELDDSDFLGEEEAVGFGTPFLDPTKPQTFFDLASPLPPEDGSSGRRFFRLMETPNEAHPFPDSSSLKTAVGKEISKDATRRSSQSQDHPQWQPYGVPHSSPKVGSSFATHAIEDPVSPIPTFTTAGPSSLTRAGPSTSTCSDEGGFKKPLSPIPRAVAGPSSQKPGIVGDVGLSTFKYGDPHAFEEPLSPIPTVPKDKRMLIFSSGQILKPRQLPFTVYEDSVQPQEASSPPRVGAGPSSDADSFWADIGLPELAYGDGHTFGARLSPIPRAGPSTEMQDEGLPALLPGQVFNPRLAPFPVYHDDEDPEPPVVLPREQPVQPPQPDTFGARLSPIPRAGPSTETQHAGLPALLPGQVFNARLAPFPVYHDDEDPEPLVVLRREQPIQPPQPDIVPLDIMDLLPDAEPDPNHPVWVWPTFPQRDPLSDITIDPPTPPPAPEPRRRAIQRRGTDKERLNNQILEIQYHCEEYQDRLARRIYKGKCPIEDDQLSNRRERRDMWEKLRTTLYDLYNADEQCEITMEERLRSYGIDNSDLNFDVSRSSDASWETIDSSDDNDGWWVPELDPDQNPADPREICDDGWLYMAQTDDEIPFLDENNEAPPDAERVVHRFPPYYRFNRPPKVSFFTIRYYPDWQTRRAPEESPLPANYNILNPEPEAMPSAGQATVGITGATTATTVTTPAAVMRGDQETMSKSGPSVGVITGSSLEPHTMSSIMRKGITVGSEIESQAQASVKSISGPGLSLPVLSESGDPTVIGQQPRESAPQVSGAPEVQGADGATTATGLAEAAQVTGTVEAAEAVGPAPEEIGVARPTEELGAVEPGPEVFGTVEAAGAVGPAAKEIGAVGPTEELGAVEPGPEVFGTVGRLEELGAVGPAPEAPGVVRPAHEELGAVGPAPEEFQFLVPVRPRRLRRRHPVYVEEDDDVDYLPPRRRRRRPRPRRLADDRGLNPVVPPAPPPSPAPQEDMDGPPLGIDMVPEQQSAEVPEVPETPRYWSEDRVKMFLLDKLGQSGTDMIAFADCCPPGESSRKSAASFFRALLGLQAKQLVILHQKSYEGNPHELFIQGLPALFQ